MHKLLTEGAEDLGCRGSGLKFTVSGLRVWGVLEKPQTPVFLGFRASDCGLHAEDSSLLTSLPLKPETQRL